jgi:hypothetical protein
MLNILSCEIHHAEECFSKNTLAKQVCFALCLHGTPTGHGSSASTYNKASSYQLLVFHCVPTAREEQGIVRYLEHFESLRQPRVVLPGCCSACWHSNWAWTVLFLAYYCIVGDCYQYGIHNWAWIGILFRAYYRIVTYQVLWAPPFVVPQPAVNPCGTAFIES